MKIERVIDELRGFMNALRIQCTSNTIIWVSCFQMKGSFENTVEWYIKKNEKEFNCINKGNIGYNELLPIIKQEIFNKMHPSISESVKEKLEWHLIEYYGLASTIENEKNPFNPLVSEMSVLLEKTSTEYEILACFITPVGEHIVVTTRGNVT